MGIDRCISRDLGNAWLLQPHCSPECLSSSEYPSKQLGLDQMRRNEAQSQGFEDCYWYLEPGEVHIQA